ncbi:aldose epimerase family protein [Entomobacter blattae]|uniref:Aldose 1-epimerase n=1 Tax=Entomobacter blattae TaxID=2762277 RepID=A0A7H1NR06_9PROT|nr:aldose epimerase family protein [Entomobacter blattae]QNT78216.1 Aldose 1-epimerase [Entomobacter blattae]
MKRHLLRYSLRHSLGGWAWLLAQPSRMATFSLAAGFLGLGLAGNASAQNITGQAKEQGEATPAQAAQGSQEGATGGLSVTHSYYGLTSNRERVERWVLTNHNGMQVSFISYGGIITEINVADKNGKPDNVVLGFGNLDGYTKDSAKGGLYFGALIGRYANRIAKGTFSLDHHTYHLAITAPPNSMHGGIHGFDKRVWHVKALPVAEHSVGAELTMESHDGDQGYPGNLKVAVTYTLDDQNTLSLHYKATTDKPTVLNLTNHSYFNLGGQGSGSIADEVLQINASHYTPTDQYAIPTGEIAPVEGTVFDFRKPMVIGTHLRDDVPQIMYARGYDHNWVIDGEYGKAPRLAARIEDPKTGRFMEVLTSQPGLQVYTSNSLDGTYAGAAHKAFRQTDAVAFEAEHFPDSPNHPKFPSTELRPGQVFDYTTQYHFGVNKN